MEFINSIEWKLYEDLCKKLLRYRGYKAKTTSIGADGGIDIKIYDKQDETKIIAIAQCKSYTTYKIGVKAIRELYGIMAADKIEKGFFFTTSKFTKPAIEFAQGKDISLLNGEEVLEYIRDLKKEEQEELYNEITEGDYTTPSCSHCGIKMIHRTSKNDSTKKFWGCKNFPQCKQIINFSRY